LVCATGRRGGTATLAAFKPNALWLHALLKRGYKSGAIENILFGNFKRALADIWSSWDPISGAA